MDKPDDATAGEKRTWDAIGHDIAIALRPSHGNAFDALKKLRLLWAELASLTPASPSAPATAEVRDGKTVAMKRAVVIQSFYLCCDLAKRADNRFEQAEQHFLDYLCDFQNSLTAPASTASFRDGVEAAAKTAREVGSNTDMLVGDLIADAIEDLIPPAASQDSGASDQTELKPDMLRALPGSGIDDSTYTAIEDALNRIEAPCTKDGRWLTLAERIDALRTLAPETTDVREQAEFKIWIERNEKRIALWMRTASGTHFSRSALIDSAEGDVLVECEEWLNLLRTPDIAATGGTKGGISQKPIHVDHWSNNKKPE